MQQPTIIGADAWPVFVGLAEGNFAGVWLRMQDGQVPKIVVSNTTIGDHISTASFAIPNQIIDAAWPAGHLLRLPARRRHAPQVSGWTIVPTLFARTVPERRQENRRAVGRQRPFHRCALC